MSAPAAFGAAQLSRAVPWPVAIAALRAALIAGLDPDAEPPRTAMPFGAGELLVMPSTAPSAEHLAGVKLATVAPDNPAMGLPRIHGIYVLFDPATLAPLATMDGAALTALRTPAVSALGVDLVAPPHARHLVVFGSGPQAHGHVHALRAVRPVETVRVVGRNPARTRALIETLRSEGVEAMVGTAADVADADVVACCTTARTPLFEGRWLSEAGVVVAVGSHEPSAREVDSETVRRCGALVESRSCATTEAGDLVMAASDGAFAPEDAVTFADVVCGRTARRPRLVKTVGMGWEDLVIAGAVLSALTGPPGIDRAHHRRGESAR